MRLKLSISPCPNDTFMFHALVHGLVDCEGLEFDVGYHDIEELNRAAMAAEPDVSKISCAVLPALKRNYAMLDSGAALGRGNGPLLVKRKGFQGELKRVAVPGEYTTANALVSGLFPLIDELSPVLFSEIAEAVELGKTDAGVLIHEGRFVYERRNLELVADLGKMWETETNLPLPLGAIIIKRDIDEETISKFDKLLAQSVRFAFDNPHLSRSFVKQHAQELEDDVIEKHISLFVNDFTISLGEEGRRAVERLLTIE